MSIQTDGFSTTIAFAESSSGILLSTYLEEKTVTPPGMDAGGENDTTSMRNTTYRTKYPKSLITLMESSFEASYDPAVYDEIIATIGTNQEITVTFPDDSTLVYWGWIDKFVPGASAEGDQPSASVTIVPSNMDADNAEIAPVYAA